MKLNTMMKKGDMINPTSDFSKLYNDFVAYEIGEQGFLTKYEDLSYNLYLRETFSSYK